MFNTKVGSVEFIEKAILILDKESEPISNTNLAKEVVDEIGDKLSPVTLRRYTSFVTRALKELGYAIVIPVGRTKLYTLNTPADMTLDELANVVRGRFALYNRNGKKATKTEEAGNAATAAASKRIEAGTGVTSTISDDGYMVFAGICMVKVKEDMSEVTLIYTNGLSNTLRKAF